jgi:hypothetical protein
MRILKSQHLCCSLRRISRLLGCWMRWLINALLVHRHQMDFHATIRPCQNVNLIRHEVNGNVSRGARFLAVLLM